MSRLTTAQKIKEPPNSYDTNDNLSGELSVMTVYSASATTDKPPEFLPGVPIISEAGSSYSCTEASILMLAP